METDYSLLTAADYEATVREYAIAQLLLAARSGTNPGLVDED